MEQKSDVGARLYQIRDGFVNMYLIAEAHGLTLVDTGTRAGAKAVLRALERRGYQPTDLKHILITHSDPDHAGGAAALKRATGATLYASPHEAEAMAQGRVSRAFRGSRLARALFQLSSLVMPIAPIQADRTIDDGVVLPMLGGLLVVGTPGHTPGHLSFFAPGPGLLFAGDSLFSGRHGLEFRDAPVVWDYAAGRASVRKQARLGAKRILCGHGPVVEQEFNG